MVTPGQRVQVPDGSCTPVTSGDVSLPAWECRWAPEHLARFLWDFYFPISFYVVQKSNLYNSLLIPNTPGGTLRMQRGPPTREGLQPSCPPGQRLNKPGKGVPFSRDYTAPKLWC